MAGRPSVTSTKQSGRIRLVWRRVVQALEYAAALILAGIMLLTVVDVGARYAFQRPIAAGFEVTEMAMQVMIYLCIAVAVASNDHIRVTLIDPVLKRVSWLKRTIDGVSGVAIAMALAGMGIAMIGLAAGKSGEVTLVLGLPIAAVAWTIALTLILSAALAAYAIVAGPTDDEADDD